MFKCEYVVVDALVPYELRIYYTFFQSIKSTLFPDQAVKK